MTDTPFLIAITGGSGSGKTTLAEALTGHLHETGGAASSVLVGDDNYYRSREALGTVGLTAREVEDRIDFDDPASKDMAAFGADIAALKAGNAIEQPVYDFGKHDRVAGAVCAVSPAPIVIVEGIHTLTVPEIAALFDLTVYVDTPDDLRLARRVLRDVRERERDLDRAVSQYLRFVRASHYRWTYPAKFTADLVIADDGVPAWSDGTPSQAAIDRMLAPVLKRVPG